MIVQVERSVTGLIQDCNKPAARHDYTLLQAASNVDWFKQSHSPKCPKVYNPVEGQLPSSTERHKHDHYTKLD